MSSHHYVKEGQEPDILIYAPTGIQPDYIYQMANWSPVITVVNSAIDYTAALGLKIDHFLTDTPDSLPDYISHQDSVKVSGLSSISLMNCLKTLKTNNKLNINILINKRQIETEKVFENIMLYLQHFSVRLITETTFFTYWEALYEKWLPQQEVIKVHTKSQSTLEIVGLTFLKQEDDAFFYESKKDGLIRITSDSPFWIGESLT